MLPQIPLCDGVFGTFRAPLRDADKLVIQTLETLGFNRAQSAASVQAVRARGGVADDAVQDAAIQLILDGAVPGADAAVGDKSVAPGGGSVVDTFDDVFVASKEQFALLSHACGRSLVDPSCPPTVLKALADVARARVTNVSLMSPQHVATMLPACVPAEWRVQREVTWTPGEGGQPTADWIRTLWLYLCSDSPALLPFSPDGSSGIPILPTTAGTLCSLLPSNVTVVTVPDSYDDEALRVRPAACLSPPSLVPLPSHTRTHHAHPHPHMPIDRCPRRASFVAHSEAAAVAPCARMCRRRLASSACESSTSHCARRRTCIRT